MCGFSIVPREGAACIQAALEKMRGRQAEQSQNEAKRQRVFSDCLINTDQTWEEQERVLRHETLWGASTAG